MSKTKRGNLSPSKPVPYKNPKKDIGKFVRYKSKYQVELPPDPDIISDFLLKSNGLFDAFYIASVFKEHGLEGYEQIQEVLIRIHETEKAIAKIISPIPNSKLMERLLKSRKLRLLRHTREMFNDILSFTGHARAEKSGMPPKDADYFFGAIGEKRNKEEKPVKYDKPPLSKEELDKIGEEAVSEIHRIFKQMNFDPNSNAKTKKGRKSQ